MAKVKIEGNASGTGTFTIAAPNSNTDRTLEIPDTDGSFVTQTTGYDVSFYEDTGTTAKFFWDASEETAYVGSFGSECRIENAAAVSDSGSGCGFSANGTATSMGSWNGYLAFLAGNNGSTKTERMRIDSSGRLLVGTTTQKAGLTVNSSTWFYEPTATVSGNALNVFNYPGNVVYGITLNDTSNGSVVAMTFQSAGTIVGSISKNTTSTSYNTSSDYRLKTDVQPMTGATERLKALNPVNFAWKVDGSRVDGFLAHEAQEVVPEAVSGEKDAVEAIGNVTDAEGIVVQENVPEPEELAEGQTWTKTEDRPVYQGIDQAKLVPLLTAALQEAVAKIEALETRIAALEVTP